jgi:hypothetical protein
MPEPFLHDFGWQFESAIDWPIDAPTRIEVPQRVQAISGFETGARLRRD